MQMHTSSGPNNKKYYMIYKRNRLELKRNLIFFTAIQYDVSN